MNKMQEEKSPSVTCSINFWFESIANGERFVKRLNEIGISGELHACKAIHEIRVKVAHINASVCLEIADVLNEAFRQINGQYDKLKEAVSEFQGSCYIDLVCYKKDIYPAMIFDGEIMKIIHALDANISIDMYEM